MRELGANRAVSDLSCNTETCAQFIVDEFDDASGLTAPKTPFAIECRADERIVANGREDTPLSATGAHQEIAFAFDSHLEVGPLLEPVLANIFIEQSLPYLGHEAS